LADKSVIDGKGARNRVGLVLVIAEPIPHQYNVKDQAGKYIGDTTFSKINSRKYQSTQRRCAKHLKKKMEEDDKVARKSGTLARPVEINQSPHPPVVAASTVEKDSGPS